MSLSQLEKSLYSTLLRSVSELMSLKPWLSLETTDIFAVQDPLTAEQLFVQVSGDNLEEPFELMAYRGAKGLEQLWELNNCPNPNFICDQSVDVTALFFTCVGKEDMDSKDSEIIADLEEFPAEMGLPVFRSCRPGYQPGHPSEADVCLLTHLVRQTYEVVKQVNDGSLSLEVKEGQEDNYVIRKPTKTRDGWVWENDHINMNLDDKLPKKYPKLKRAELAVLKELPLGQRQLRMDLMVSPFVSGDENEETPSTFLFTVSDYNTGEVYCARVEEPGAKLPKYRESLLQTFYEMLVQLGERPQSVHVEAYSLCDMLGDVIGKLDIQLAHHELPAWRPAKKEAIMRHFETRYTRIPGKIFL